MENNKGRKEEGGGGGITMTTIMVGLCRFLLNNIIITERVPIFGPRDSQLALANN